MGINTHNFIKHGSKFEKRAYFMQNFNELDMKKISDCKALAFEVWGLKTSLGKFGPKPFAKDLESH